MCELRLKDHLADALKRNGSISDWFVIALQGSQNYGLSDKDSDIDSKLLVLPTIEDVALNRNPISTTHVMENEEHCDLKDTRLYFKILRKQNINFVELLFSDYCIVNKKYQHIWDQLLDRRETIARYDSIRALKCMKGMSYEKLHALCHEYPSKKEILEKYGFDPKQLSHILRLLDFAKKYIDGELYENCLKPDLDTRNYLLSVKRNSVDYSKEDATRLAEQTVKEITQLVDSFCLDHINYKPNKQIDEFLDEKIVELVKLSWKNDL